MCAESGAAALVIREFRRCPEDAEVASEILCGSFGAAGWSARSLLEDVGGRTYAYLSERDGQATGFIIARQIEDEAEVLNLAVREPYRRQGEGRALVNRLLQRLRESGTVRLFLEVRESNLGAFSFYETSGFRSVGRRERYYSDPDEAAIVMELWLKGPVSIPGGN